MGPDGPKWAQEDFFPTNPDLADILGRTDFDFENFYFLDFLDVPAHAKNGPRWAQMGQEDFFLLIQTLPTFWAERMWILRIFMFLILGRPGVITFHVLTF